RQDWRTFRVDRIGSQVNTGPRFAPREPPDQDIAAYVSRSVSYTPYPYRAVVTLQAPLDVVAERVPSTVGVLEAIDEHRCRLQTGGYSLEALSIWLPLIGVEFEVQEPPELIDQLRSLAERLSRAAVKGALGNV